MKLKLFLLSFLVLAGTSSFGQPSQPTHQWTFGAFTDEALNDDLSFSYNTIKPFFLYRAELERLKIVVLFAALYNRVEFQSPLSRAVSFLIGTEPIFHIAGDSPRINGADLTDFEFDGHRVRGWLGAEGGGPPIAGIPYRVRLQYELQWHKLYGFGSRPFSRPQDYWHQGPTVRLTWGRGPIPEQFDSDPFRGALELGFRWRRNLLAWGPVGTERDVRRYSQGSVGFTSNPALSPRISIRMASQASFVHRSDRLNALRDGALNQETLGMVISDVKADRALSAELGLKVHLLPKTLLAVRPFGHGIAFQDVTPSSRYRDSGGGVGLRLMGALYDRKLLWDATYANLFSTRPDKGAGIHAVRLYAAYTL